MRPFGGRSSLWIIIAALAIALCGSGSSEAETGKVRLVHVDSYHREYNGSELPFQGFCDALLELGYLDNRDQIAELLKNDTVDRKSVV